MAIAFIALLAFTLQNFVVQTHIHGGAQVGAASASLVLDRIVVHGQQPGKFPAGNGPANCPICQELLRAGSYAAPAAAAVLVSTVATSIEIAVIEIAAIAQAHSHNWNSRAPPLA